jgi:hypothetical protein
MSSVQIREAIEKVTKFLAERPEKARIKNPPVTIAGAQRNFHRTRIAAAAGTPYTSASIGNSSATE